MLTESKYSELFERVRWIMRHTPSRAKRGVRRGHSRRMRAKETNVLRVQMSSLTLCDEHCTTETRTSKPRFTAAMDESGIWIGAAWRMEDWGLVAFADEIGDNGIKSEDAFVCPAGEDVGALCGHIEDQGVSKDVWTSSDWKNGSIKTECFFVLFGVVDAEKDEDKDEDEADKDEEEADRGAFAEIG